MEFLNYVFYDFLIATSEKNVKSHVFWIKKHIFKLWCECNQCQLKDFGGLRLDRVMGSCPDSFSSRHTHSPGVGTLLTTQYIWNCMQYAGTDSLTW